jgi:hypothetical protein
MFQAAPEQFAEVVDLAGLLFEGGRPSPQHRQDRSLDRLGECLLRRIGAPPNSRGKLSGRDTHPGPDRIRHAVQELREDRARVAACPFKGRVGSRSSRLSYREFGGSRQRRCGGTQCRREVRPRVGVRHRKDVDAVQRLLLACHCQSTGA